MSWPLTPDLVLATALVAALYVNGMRKQRAKDYARHTGRHVLFFAGLLTVFLSLQSPIDELADRSFAFHELQHLLLQTIGPTLLMAALPHAILAAGVPVRVRRAVLAPALGNAGVRALFGFLGEPWIATLLFVASMYAWHWPPYYDLAVEHEGWHYVMHLTMLAAALFFFAAAFDPRPAPLGPRYGTRIAILVAAMTANMLLGIVLSLKDSAWYSAYVDVARVDGMSVVTDERLGGLLMWIPGSSLCVPAFLIVLRMWGAQEGRHAERQRLGAPSAAATRAGNRSTGFWLALVALAGFATTLGIGVLVAHR